MSTPSDRLFTMFLKLLVDTLAAMVPGSGDDTNETRREIAHLFFEAFQPKDAVEVMIAARAVAANHASMDAFARAARPGLSDDTAMRLRANAVAAARVCDAAVRVLNKRPKPQPQPTGKPVAPSALPQMPTAMPIPDQFAEPAAKVPVSPEPMMAET